MRKLADLQPFSHQSHRGFTLAELLISLAILGVIATFTIPKILVVQQNNQYKAEAKEVAAMVSDAYQQLASQNGVTTSTRASDLSPYLNYTSIDTSGTLIDAVPTVASYTCDGSNPCLKLHNGGVLWLQGCSFNGTTNNNFIRVAFDPDGVLNGTTADGPGKAIAFLIYYNGFLTTRGQTKTGSTNSCGVPSLSTTYDPSWFSWN